MKKPIDKQIFLNAIECRTLGWFLRSDNDSGEPTLADRFRMEQGSQIGQLARTLYPAAIFVSPGPDAARRTKRFMTDASVRVLFEATFVAGKCTAKADIAVRSKRGWKIIEVKSSLRDTDRMDELVADLTYTVVAARRAGVVVTEASLLLLSRDFRKDMPTTELFVEVEQTDSVNERAPEFDLAWDEVERTTSTPRRPKPSLIQACKDCSFFATECHGTSVTNPVFEIPRLGEKKLADLAKLGILEITDLPDRFKLTETQQRVVDAVRTGRTFIGALRTGLARIEWPAYYLDFESTQTALPLYSDLAPYEQIPTQYSIHRCSHPGAIPSHVDFVADPSRDCQRDLTERLIHDLGTTGSVIVYSSFERTRIRALAKRFPDLAPQLHSIDARLFDLHAIVQREYYHPEFHGSTSIKNVLPVIVPELTYEGMEIGDGTAASAVFALIAMGKYPDDEARRLLDLLRVYCRQDTLALVKLHETLLALCE